MTTLLALDYPHDLHFSMMQVCKVYPDGYGKSKAHCITACEYNPCDSADKVCTNVPDETCEGTTPCPHKPMCKEPCDDFDCGDNEVNKDSSCRDDTWM